MSAITTSVITTLQCSQNTQKQKKYDSVQLKKLKQIDNENYQLSSFLQHSLINSRLAHTKLLRLAELTE